jgi:hypothetical protein
MYDRRASVASHLHGNRHMLELLAYWLDTDDANLEMDLSQRKSE